MAFSAQGVLTNCVIPGITITEAIDDERRGRRRERQGITADDVMARMMEKDPVDIGPLRRPAGGRRRGGVPRQRAPPAGSPAPPSPSTAAPSAASDAISRLRHPTAVSAVS